MHLADGWGTANTVTKTFSWDPFGNVVSSTQTVPKGTSGSNRTFTTGYEYNGDDSLKKITYPSGRIVEYVRNAAGRIRQIKATFNGSTTTLVSNVTYHPFGPAKQIVYTNGLVQARSYDSGYRMGNLTLANPSTWDVLEYLDYTLDAAGNVVAIEDQLDGQYSREYGYDVLNRLRWDSGVSSSPTYSYDANGNRLSRASGTGFGAAQSIGYVSGTNRMAQFNSNPVSYDAMGSVTDNGNGLTFEYNAAGRLHEAQLAVESRLTTLYNGLGELARTRMESYDGCADTWNVQTWEYYSFASDGRALALLQEHLSRVEWEWAWLDDLPLLQFQDSYDGSGSYQGTTVTYLHPDHLGTPRIGSNAAGQITWRYRSDAFGKATVAGSHTVRLRLPGQIALGIGGIHYNYYRDYDPNVGRYLESDPIGLEGGLNTYDYARASPLRFTDPSGRSVLQSAVARRLVDANEGRLPGPFGPWCGPPLIAQWIPDVWMTDHCKQHDKCYGTCGSDRLICDLQFLLSGGAPAYYAAIRSFGWIPYDLAQREACKGENCEQRKSD